MKKIGIILAFSFMALSLAACGKNNSVDNNQETNQETNQQVIYTENGIALPDEYASGIIGYKWVITYESGTNVYFVFDENARWKKYEYVADEWCEVNCGPVSYNSAGDIYMLVDDNYCWVDEFTYDERGILYSTTKDYMYCNDVEPLEENSTPVGTAGSNYYANEEYFKDIYAQYEGTWHVVWPEDPNDYAMELYAISAEGTFEHYMNYGNGLEFDATGSIAIIEGEFGTEVYFFNEDGNEMFKAEDKGLYMQVPEIGCELHYAKG